MDYFIALAVGVTAGIVALAAIVANERFGWRSKPNRTSWRELTQFILQDGQLVDMTDDARNLCDIARQTVDDWPDLRHLFANRFPDMPKQPPRTQILCRAEDDASTFLRIAPEEDLVKVTLETGVAKPSALHFQAMQRSELTILRSTMSAAPSPIWQSDQRGLVKWHNSAYRALCHKLNHNDIDAAPFDLVLPDGDTPQTTRIGVGGGEAGKLWFEVTSRRSEDRWHHYATDINAIVSAEIAQRNFPQTLTKTFAHLPIGLAVFDKDRRLVLFNPALIDLTDLPADFLSSRPNLHSFFDHMRENRMMPEPKNYKSWRDHMAELTDAARDDRYSETWNLPSGLTYKITGRPHPDGAVAFLLEDISAEISLTRRFRSELELSQSVLDSLDEAIAVFSPLGILTFSNAQYRSLWRCDPDSAFAEMSILDATNQWKNECKPSAIWPEIREYVMNLRDRAEWSTELEMRTGQGLICAVEPVAGGATVVRFATAETGPKTTARIEVDAAT